MQTNRRVHLIVVPFDSGVGGARMGAGPDALLDAGLVEQLATDGCEVTVARLIPAGAWRAELRTAFELHHLIAQEIAATPEDTLPLVLGGNCNVAVGAVAGVSTGREPGLIWMDAHGDLNTPETDESGFLDGQGLA